MNKNTWLKGLGMVILGAVVGVIYSSFTAGNFNLDLNVIWKTAALAGITYVFKALFPRLPSDYPVPPDSDTTRTTINR